MFVADEMLKKTARWMRILGVDVLYPETTDDSAIMDIVSRTGRVLLTMDKYLYRRCFKRGVPCFFVPKGSSEEQIIAIMKEYGLKMERFPSRTLCPQCNGKLKEVGKKAVKEKVFPSIYGRHRLFWLCDKCGKIFWPGSHWVKIRKAACRIRKALGEKA